GQPAETGRAARHLDDGLALAVLVDRDHLVRVHVGEPQPAVMPARALRKDEVVEQQLGLNAHRAACCRARYCSFTARPRSSRIGTSTFLTAGSALPTRAMTPVK